MVVGTAGWTVAAARKWRRWAFWSSCAAWIRGWGASVLAHWAASCSLSKTVQGTCARPPDCSALKLLAELHNDSAWEALNLPRRSSVARCQRALPFDPSL